MGAPNNARRGLENRIYSRSLGQGGPRCCRWYHGSYNHVWMLTVKDCNQCGKCCTLYGGGGLTASSTDLESWETHRPDIDRYVAGGEIWISPVTGKQMLRCPWLRKMPNQDKYLCRIYFDRPEDCRHYPTRIDEMIRDGCEMLEPKDFLKPKQAQTALDELMADSRPAVSER